MVTGQQAFPGRTSAVVFDAILNREPAAISRYRVDLPPELEHVVVQTLDKDPVGRFQSMAELKAELTALKRARDSGQVAAAAASKAVPEPPPELSEDEMPTVRAMRPSEAVRAAATGRTGPTMPSEAPARRVPAAPCRGRRGEVRLRTRPTSPPGAPASWPAVRRGHA